MAERVEPTAGLWRLSRKAVLAAAGLAIPVAWMFYAWLVQMVVGLGVTGLRNEVIWGIYIINFIWFIGLAHGGVVVSAAARVLKIEELKPVTRVAELVTLIALPIAGLNIIIDLGRPDRAFNLFKYYVERVGQSPLSWDLTAITIYFVLSAVYFLISLRPDIHRVYDRAPTLLKPIYRLLLIGYREEEEERLESVERLMAAALLILVFAGLYGVIAWLFQLVPRPGWITPFQGPSFITAALTSAIAAVLLVSALVVKVMGWEAAVSEEAFKKLSLASAVGVFLYVWLMFHEHITAQYHGLSLEREISNMLLWGEFAWLFWPTLVALFILPALVLALYATGRVGLRAALISATLVVAGFWNKRALILLPPLVHPPMPLPEGIYVPTWVEVSVFAGSVALFALAFIIAAKLIPLLPLSEVREHGVK